MGVTRDRWIGVKDLVAAGERERPATRGAQADQSVPQSNKKAAPRHCCPVLDPRDTRPHHRPDKTHTLSTDTMASSPALIDWLKSELAMNVLPPARTPRVPCILPRSAMCFASRAPLPLLPRASSDEMHRDQSCVTSHAHSAVMPIAVASTDKLGEVFALLMKHNILSAPVYDQKAGEHVAVIDVMDIVAASMLLGTHWPPQRFFPFAQIWACVGYGPGVMCPSLPLPFLPLAHLQCVSPWKRRRIIDSSAHY